MIVLAEFSIFPVDKGESVSGYVARAVSVIKNSGLKYSLNPMGTCIEGHIEEVMGLIKRCMYELQEDCNRIYVTLKIDYRKGRVNAIDSKVASIERHLE
ncbi:MAG: MTH1187 family thiamine-binding protein [Spirochaetes bacterium]|nr:MTH1187 family thiamine-binding protein [Spirochaetota bacterium]